jgi:hypothetical protein
MFSSSVQFNLTPLLSLSSLPLASSILFFSSPPLESLILTKFFSSCVAGLGEADLDP